MQEKFMKRAIELAKNGYGKVSPNPLVGCVLVKDNEIIAEGWHKKYGDLHAETMALSIAKEKALVCEMYVTLEPCSHFGKQPPCANAIVKSGVKKVYIGSDDPNSLVSGKGIKILQTAGIEVKTHVLKEECDKLNEIFFHYITHDTPYVALKYAMTLDGKIASHTGSSKWISGEKSRKYVHLLRNKYTAILVGVGTVLADDPLLTSRIENTRNPIRIIVDTNLRTPLSSNLVKTAKEVKTIIATCSYNKRYEDCGIELLQVEKKDNQVDIKNLLKKLRQKNIDSILVEGGGNINFSIIKENLFQKIYAFIAPKYIGGNGKSPVEGIGIDDMNDAIKLKDINYKKIGEDILLRGYN